MALTLTIASTVLRAAVDYRSLAHNLEPIVRHELREWGIGGVTVALVDGSETVYLRGFGEATADSIFRVGSISKLFNAIAVMQLVEAGELDLDAPLPADLLPLNPFPGAPPVTLRQLLCHRSGLQREGAVGGYLDPSEPGLEATIASLKHGVLVTRPGEKTRYSNVGASLAGYVAAKTAGQPFESLLQERVLGPLGLTDSCWFRAGVPPGRLVKAHMRVADGRGGWTRRQAPLFDLGTIPAGNLLSTAPDLARFASSLLAGGGGLVKPETLQAMWTPQLTGDDTGFGLGFSIGKFRAHRSIGHGGEVWGYSTSFLLLPEVGLAAIVLGNEDIASGRIRRIRDAALSLMLEAKLGEVPPATDASEVPARLADFAGDYESSSYWARIEVVEDQLRGEISGQPLQLTPDGEDSFLAESRVENRARVVFARDANDAVTSFTRGGQTFVRVPDDVPSLRKEWQPVLGSYGSDFAPIVISERYGHLYAMTENMVDYRLTPVNRRVCALGEGMYVDEEVVFLINENGDVRGIDFANMIFPRRK
jgi:serine beta-lactamase-like protein LACTB